MKKKKKSQTEKVLMHYAICALKMYYVLAIRECEMLPTEVSSYVNVWFPFA